MIMVGSVNGFLLELIDWKTKVYGSVALKITRPDLYPLDLRGEQHNQGLVSRMIGRDTMA